MKNCGMKKKWRNLSCVDWKHEPETRDVGSGLRVVIRAVRLPSEIYLFWPLRRFLGFKRVTLPLFWRDENRFSSSLDTVFGAEISRLFPDFPETIFSVFSGKRRKAFLTCFQNLFDCQWAWKQIFFWRSHKAKVLVPHCAPTSSKNDGMTFLRIRFEALCLFSFSVSNLLLL